MSRAEYAGRLGYQAHHVVDAGKAPRVILDVLVTPSEVTEKRPMLVTCSGTPSSAGASDPAR